MRKLHKIIRVWMKNFKISDMKTIQGLKKFEKIEKRFESML